VTFCGKVNHFGI